MRHGNPSSTGAPTPLLGHAMQTFPNAHLAASSSGLGWHGVAAELRSHPTGDLPPFQPDQLEITIALAGEREAVVSRKGAGLRQRTRVGAGTIWISPMDVSKDDIRITRPLSRILLLDLPSQPLAALSDTLGGSRFGADAIHFLAGVQDELIRQMGHALLAEMARVPPGQRHDAGRVPPERRHGARRQALNTGQQAGSSAPRAPARGSSRATRKAIGAMPHRRMLAPGRPCCPPSLRPPWLAATAGIPPPWRPPCRRRSTRRPMHRPLHRPTCWPWTTTPPSANWSAPTWATTTCA